MDDITISKDEMIEFIYKGCKESISKYTIEFILELQEELVRLNDGIASMRSKSSAYETESVELGQHIKVRPHFLCTI